MPAASAVVPEPVSAAVTIARNRSPPRMALRTMTRLPLLFEPEIGSNADLRNEQGAVPDRNSPFLNNHRRRHNRHNRNIWKAGHNLYDPNPQPRHLSDARLT